MNQRLIFYFFNALNIIYSYNLEWPKILHFQKEKILYSFSRNEIWFEVVKEWTSNNSTWNFPNFVFVYLWKNFKLLDFEFCFKISFIKLCVSVAIFHNPRKNKAKVFGYFNLWWNLRWLKWISQKIKGEH